MKGLQAARRFMGPREASPVERIGDDHPVRIHWVGRAIFDESGFWHPEHQDHRVEWQVVRRVALGYRMLTWRSWDFNFWAFQTRELLEAAWVDIIDPPEPESDAFSGETEKSRRFCEEVYRRFNVPLSIPPMCDWVDSKMAYRAYVVWPACDIGKPLYHTVRRRWWWPGGRLVHANT